MLMPQNAIGCLIVETGDTKNPSWFHLPTSVVMAIVEGEFENPSEVTLLTVRVAGLVEFAAFHSSCLRGVRPRDGAQ